MSDIVREFDALNKAVTKNHHLLTDMKTERRLCQDAVAELKAQNDQAAKLLDDFSIYLEVYTRLQTTAAEEIIKDVLSDFVQSKFDSIQEQISAVMIEAQEELVRNVRTTFHKNFEAVRNSLEHPNGAMNLNAALGFLIAKEEERKRSPITRVVDLRNLK